MTTALKTQNPAQSRVLAIEILNFMSIRGARLEFDEGNILNLVGYNDSGKSAITRALEVICFDAYSKEQNDFIMDGEEFFGIGLEFSDGVEINKYKYKTGRSLWELTKDGEILYTNKLDNNISAMDTVPEVIARYLNVLEDEHTGEKLNVRRNTDLLFLVGMSGGDVYKIINSVLHCDTLSEAVKRLNTDRNAVQTELTSKATRLETLKQEVKNYRVVDVEELENLKTLQSSVMTLSARKQGVQAIGDKHFELQGLQPNPELSILDTSRIIAITGVIEAKRALDNVSGELPPELSYVQTQRLHDIVGVMQLASQLSTEKPHDELPTVDVTKLSMLAQLFELHQAFSNVNQEVSVLDEQLENTNQELENVRLEFTKITSQNNFKLCKNCGSIAV